MGEQNYLKGIFSAWRLRAALIEDEAIGESRPFDARHSNQNS